MPSQNSGPKPDCGYILLPSLLLALKNGKDKDGLENTLLHPLHPHQLLPQSHHRLQLGRCPAPLACPARLSPTLATSTAWALAHGVTCFRDFNLVLERKLKPPCMTILQLREGHTPQDSSWSGDGDLCRGLSKG